MRDYELLLLIRPNLDENAAREAGEQVADLVQNHQGEVTKTNVWGRRKLAYPIDDQLEATYILHKFRGDPASLREIEFELKLNESVLRYLITKDINPAVSDLAMTEEEAAPVPTQSSAAAEVEAEGSASEAPAEEAEVEETGAVETEAGETEVEETGAAETEAEETEADASEDDQSDEVAGEEE